MSLTKKDQQHKRNLSVQSAVYNGLVLPAAYGVLSAAVPFHKKLRRTFRARRNIRERWTETAPRGLRPIWFHVASVGEYEQARPVISALEKNFPDVAVAITFTSPSGYDYAIKQERPNGEGNVCFMEYLPLDFQHNARFSLDVLDPRLIVFVKFDLWPNLIWEAARRGIPSLLIDATLSENSYRNSAAGRMFYRAVYPYLERILAISDGDAGRFVECAPSHSGISVIGDTRFDRVAERKLNGNGKHIDVDVGDRLVIVAGSTWPKDELHLLPSLARMASERDDLYVILAPHEPSISHVAELSAWARSNGFESSTLSQSSFSSARTGNRALIVDSVGVLAEMYRYGDIAYIGGAFSTGVHSVIEPAIMGMPVMFGPLHQNSLEAIELLRQDAAFSVSNVEDMTSRLRSLDNGIRDRMGGHARAYVESKLGATDLCMATIDNYISL